MGGGRGGGGFENTKGSNATAHGAQRMQERAFTAADVVSTKTGGLCKAQADGAKVYIKEISPGKYNGLVEGEKGPITVLKGIGQKAVERLGRNYGWRD